jgi:hypothetical protein
MMPFVRMNGVKKGRDYKFVTETLFLNYLSVVLTAASVIQIRPHTV